MKKISYFLVLSCLVITQWVYAASVSIDEKNWLVTIYEFVYDFTCSSWNDSVSVCYPSEYTTAQWTDWRKIAYPGGYSANWTTSEWTDWRKIAYPASYSANWTTSEWTDWRKIAYPASYSDNWTTTQGTDWRKIAYPASYSANWTTSEWTDWRKIAYPGSYSANWTTTQGTDWRKIAYPGSYSANWTTTQGTDWRKIAYPNNWTLEEWHMWMRITGNKIELIFREAQYLPLFEIYRKIFSTDDELVDFIIYTFLNDAYENNVNVTLTSNSIATPTPTINYWGNTNNSNELDDLIDSINNNSQSVCWKNSHVWWPYQCMCNDGYVWVNSSDIKNMDCKLPTATNTNNLAGTNPVVPTSSETTQIVAANMLWILWYITLRDSEEEYQLESKILRQEIIGIAIKLKWITLPENYSCNNKFKDVTRSKPNNWVCRVAEVSAENGIISNENTLFNPEINVSLTEALAMILNSLNKPYQWYKNNSDLFNPKAVDWQKSVLSYAQHNWIITSTFVNPNLPVNRWDVFLMIAKALGW